MSGYGDELLSYLRDNTKLFPTIHREKTFRRKAFAVGLGISSEILDSDRFKQASDDSARAAEFGALARRVQRKSRRGPVGDFTGIVIAGYGEDDFFPTLGNALHGLTHA